MSIGIALFLFVMELLWYATGREEYYRQVRFWLRIFVLTFAIGVASGLPMALQFGTNWSAFAAAVGSFFGNLLGFETTIAFTLETAFLGLMVFGWGKVPRLVHLCATLMVLIGASLSAFWIMVANSWMQMPRGIHFEKGLVIVDSYKEAIFNPDSLISFAHMWVACIETSMFMIAGLSAYALVREAQREAHRAFFVRSFKAALSIALAVSLVQGFLGDQSGIVVSKNQPEKLAALELHWETNPYGTGAPWSVVAVPRAGGGSNSFALEVPDGLSLITTHSPTGSVLGLNTFDPDDRPTTAEAAASYYAFRVMLLCGVIMILLALFGFWYWWRGFLKSTEIQNHRTFLKIWIASIPLGFIATEAGWMVREIGRQPWVIYHIMRTREATSSGLEAPVLWTVIAGIVVIYAVAISAFVYFTRRIVLAGPDLESRVPWTR